MEEGEGGIFYTALTFWEWRRQESFYSLAHACWFLRYRVWGHEENNRRREITLMSSRNMWAWPSCRQRWGEGSYTYNQSLAHSATIRQFNNVFIGRFCRKSFINHPQGWLYAIIAFRFYLWIDKFNHQLENMKHCRLLDLRKLCLFWRCRSISKCKRVRGPMRHKFISVYHPINNNKIRWLLVKEA